MDRFRPISSPIALVPTARGPREVPRARRRRQATPRRRTGSPPPAARSFPATPIRKGLAAGLPQGPRRGNRRAWTTSRTARVRRVVLTTPSRNHPRSTAVRAARPRRAAIPRAGSRVGGTTFLGWAVMASVLIGLDSSWWRSCSRGCRGMGPFDLHLVRRAAHGCDEQRDRLRVNAGVHLRRRRHRRGGRHRAGDRPSLAGDRVPRRRVVLRGRLVPRGHGRCE